MAWTFLMQLSRISIEPFVKWHSNNNKERCTSSSLSRTLFSWHLPDFLPVRAVWWHSEMRLKPVGERMLTEYLCGWVDISPVLPHNETHSYPEIKVLCVKYFNLSHTYFSPSGPVLKTNSLSVCPERRTYLIWKNFNYLVKRQLGSKYNSWKTNRTGRRGGFKGKWQYKFADMRFTGKLYRRQFKGLE